MAGHRSMLSQMAEGPHGENSSQFKHDESYAAAVNTSGLLEKYQDSSNQNIAANKSVALNPIPKSHRDKNTQMFQS